jgi:Flp pilus assembly protein TadG
MSEKGTSMIETAIAIPVVLFVVISIFTLAFASYNKVIITSAAREGAREYAVSSSQTQALKAIEDVIALSVVQLAYDVEFRESGDSVEVLVTGRQRVFAPGLSIVFSNRLSEQLALSGSAKYRKEGW